ncbi:MAG: hypothetical protein FWG72_10695, partial [Oscillospiraceae bacterium]|nr:hypothetical protein [Oscillospiraceae bacterium]
MYNHNSEYASIEDTLTIIHTYVTDDIVKSHLFLLEPLAWAAYVEGRPEEMAEFLDRYYRQFPKIVLQTPQSAITRYSLLCMDYRESMKDVTRTMKKLTFIKGAKITSPSISQNLPFFHRSFRDLSEYALDTEENLLLWTKTIGVLLLEESGTLIDSIRAGLAYEQGNLAAAHEFALSACAKRKDSFAPEIQFCSFM